MLYTNCTILVALDVARYVLLQITLVITVAEYLQLIKQQFKICQKYDTVYDGSDTAHMNWDKKYVKHVQD